MFDLWFFLHQEVVASFLENLVLGSGLSIFHQRGSPVTDLLPISLGRNRPAACENTFLANIVSLSAGFSSVTSPQMHPSGILGLFSLLQQSDAAICIFPDCRNIWVWCLGLIIQGEGLHLLGSSLMPSFSRQHWGTNQSITMVPEVSGLQ